MHWCSFTLLALGQTLSCADASVALPKNYRISTSFQDSSYSLLYKQAWFLRISATPFGDRDILSKRIQITPEDYTAGAFPD